MPSDDRNDRTATDAEPAHSTFRTARVAPPSSGPRTSVRTGPGLPGVDMVHVVRHGDDVHVAGQLAFDTEGRLVGSGDALAQCRQALANVHAALASVGATVDDLVKLVCYLVDSDDLDAYGAAKEEAYGQDPPASTCVVVEKLLVPGALVEIEAIALIRDRDRSSREHLPLDH